MIVPDPEGGLFVFGVCNSNQEFPAIRSNLTSFPVRDIIRLLFLSGGSSLLARILYVDDRMAYMDG